MQSRKLARASAIGAISLSMVPLTRRTATGDVVYLNRASRRRILRESRSALFKKEWFGGPQLVP